MLKIRLAAIILVLLVSTTGCGSLLSKVTNKNSAQPASTTTSDSVQNSAGQTTEVSIEQLQTAIKDSKSVKLVAQDTGGSLVLDEAKKTSLIKMLADAGELKASKQLTLIAGNPEFPAYQLQIGDSEIKIDLYDSLHFGVGNENGRQIFMETGSMAQSFNKWLPPRTYTDSSLGYLFKATKVTVKGDAYTEETDVTPARNAILRSIRSVQLQSSTLPDNASEPLKITFVVNNNKYVLDIYDDYLGFNKAIYKLPSGKSTIEGLLTQS